LRGLQEDHLVSSYSLSVNEIASFRGIAHNTLNSTIRKHSVFAHYYRSRIQWPFAPVIFIVILIVAFCIAAFCFESSIVDLTDKSTYPLVASAATFVAVAVAAIGWGFGAWFSYRNSQLQHTINVIFTRFAQTPFSENTKRFHGKFGYEIEPRITLAEIKRLENSTEEDQAAAQSAKFLLNYYEFIAVGVLRGDLDLNVVESTLRGNMMFLFEKTAPMINEARKSRPATMEYFVDLISHLREP